MAIATELHRRSVQIDPDISGHVPVIFGTRIPVARVFAELANDHSLSDVADNLGINESLLRDLLNGVSIRLDRSFTG